MKFNAIAAAMISAVALIVAPGCEGPVSVKTDSGKNSSTEKQDRPAVPDAPPYAKAVFDKTEHNFGVMQSGEEGTHEFTLTNKSKDRDLLLKKGPTTCKCTLSDLPDGKLKPGESTKIKLSWTIPQGMEHFSQTAQIWTSDPENKTIVLSVVGEVRRAIEINPPDHWRVGSIDDTEVREFTGFITSATYDSFKILSVTTSATSNDKTVSPDNKKTPAKTKSGSPIITAKFTPLEPKDRKGLRAKSGYKIKLSVKANGMVGTMKQPVTIKTELPDKAAPGGIRIADFTVELQGSMTGAVIFRPTPGVKWLPDALIARLGHFSAAKGKSAALWVYIAEPEGEPFKITKVTADPSFLTAKLERVGTRKEKPKKGERTQFLLTLSVPPNSPPVSRLLKNSGKITLETNHPKARNMKLGIEFHSN